MTLLADTLRVEDMERTRQPQGRLFGRRRERDVLNGLVRGALAGRSGTLVLHGEAGIGKTALLDFVRRCATGCQVVQISGVEAEADLAFGGLHQLCAPFLDHLADLPDPQRAAVETAFGFTAGDPPDRFLVGLAVLGLLAEVSGQQPLVCIVDDAQWLDQISSQVLAFVARRLHVERVALLFAVRDPINCIALQDLPSLTVTGLDSVDAEALLAATYPGPVDDQVMDRVLAEARGNPLALLEIPRQLEWLDVADDRLDNQLEKRFARRLQALAPETQQLVLLAAADTVGDVVLLHRAAMKLDIDTASAVAEAEDAELLTVGTMVRFRHPLVRSAAYRSAPAVERRQVHRALAEATDPDRDPDRRVWHFASAATGPNEDVAAELEAAAVRARMRGGISSAAAFLVRAAELTPDPRRRGARSLAAAQAKSRAGEFTEALDLLDGLRLQPLDEREQATADLVRGQLLFSYRSASAGLPLLLDAATKLQRLDPALAAETYRDAVYAALTAGRLPGDRNLEHVATAIVARPRDGDTSRGDLLLEGLARIIVDGYAAGVPLVQRALGQYRAADLSAEEALGWLPLACRLAHNIWEFDVWSELSEKLVTIATGAGALSLLPSALLLRLSNRMYAGGLAAAQALADQAVALTEVTGSSVFTHYCALVSAAWLGDEQRVRELTGAITGDPMLREEGKSTTATGWAVAVLCNGSERHEAALEAARQGSAHPQELGLSTWALVELVEAAARLERPTEAADAVARIKEMAAASGSAWARGTAAYVCALVDDDAAGAERLYLEAIAQLERAGVKIYAARAHLVYGEWLNAQGRLAAARQSLDTAVELLTEMGAAGFAARAHRALAVAGGAAAAPAPASSAAANLLTAQELQIARLAAEGMTNPEIGAQLFLSAHTIEWHLRKVFSKLGIRSRRHIAERLGG